MQLIQLFQLDIGPSDFEGLTCFGKPNVFSPWDTLRLNPIKLFSGRRGVSICGAEVKILTWLKSKERILRINALI